MKKILLLICSPIFILATLSSQQRKTDTPKGGSFNFENYQSSTQSLYKEIDQTKIKALKLSFREIFDTVAVNNFLFNPKAKKENRISLAGLLFWAVKEGNIVVYDPNSYSSEFFAEPVSWGEIIKENIPRMKTDLVFDSQKDTIIVSDDIDPAEIRSYLLMEASIYDLNNKVVAVRPIGLCPIRTNVDPAMGRIIRRKLFWVYFPDIMPLLSHYIPEPRIKGAKTALDFFTKNLYRGDYSRYFHMISPMLEAQMYGDTTRLVEGFDVSWIYAHVKDGVYISPHNKLYQGIGRQEDLINSEQPQDQEVIPGLIHSVKTVYKTVNLRNIENYPIYFPEETPFLGQKSLIDVIYSGIENNTFTVYQPFEDSIPMTFQEVEGAMGGGYFRGSVQNSDGLFLDTTFVRQANRSEVKKYIIKEQEFFDNKGVLIDSKITGLIPVREYTEENSEISKNKLLFFVPFKDKAVKKLLSENYAYRFTIDDNFSFLSFFLNEKFRIESIASELSKLGP